MVFQKRKKTSYLSFPRTDGGGKKWLHPDARCGSPHSHCSWWQSDQAADLHGVAQEVSRTTGDLLSWASWCRVWWFRCLVQFWCETLSLAANWEIGSFVGLLIGWLWNTHIGCWSGTRGSWNDGLEPASWLELNLSLCDFPVHSKCDHLRLCKALRPYQSHLERLPLHFRVTATSSSLDHLKS